MLAIYCDCELPHAQEYTPVDLALILQTQLDLELLNKLAESTSRILRDHDSSELGLAIHTDLTSEMWTVWKQWEDIHTTSFIEVLRLLNYVVFTAVLHLFEPQSSSNPNMRFENEYGGLNWHLKYEAMNLV